MAVSSVAVEVPLVDELASVEESESVALADGGGGGGPCGRSVADEPAVVEVASVDDVASVLSRSLARVVSRLCSCFSSAVSASDDDDDEVLDDDALVDDAPDEDVPSPLSEASRFAASVDEVESVPAAPGGGPGGGPRGWPLLAAIAPSSVESDTSLPSELLPVWICESTDMKLDTAGLTALASTVDVPVGLAGVDVVEVEAESAASSVDAVWLALELFWLCMWWWWVCVLSETDTGKLPRKAGRSVPACERPARLPKTAAGRCSTWDPFPLAQQG